MSLICSSLIDMYMKPMIIVQESAEMVRSKAIQTAHRCWLRIAVEYLIISSCAIQSMAQVWLITVVEN